LEVFVAKQLARELINAGVHFGHGVSRWNPKMAPFIFAKRGNIHVIDVKETLKGILIAKRLLAEIVSGGSDVVFVGTKRQAQKAVEAAANRCGMHYVWNRKARNRRPVSSGRCARFAPTSTVCGK
jgi:small subunit ribosomal protein S2